MLQILHESAKEKAALLALETGLSCQAGESLRGYLHRMDRQLGEGAVMAAVRGLLARLQSERGGQDQLM